MSDTAAESMPVAADGAPLWTTAMFVEEAIADAYNAAVAASRVSLFTGEFVTVEISDAVNDCIVITVFTPDGDTGARLEVSTGEAREIVAGIAAVL